MTIETKYNIDDEVCAIISGGARKLKISRIFPHYSKSYQVITYGFENTPYTGHFDFIEEHKLFSTKEELLKSL